MAKEPSSGTDIIKVVNAAVLDSAMTYTANCIRNKTGGIDQIAWDSAKGFGDAVDTIETGIETKTYTWDQARPEVKNFIDNVTYNPSDYSNSSIAQYVTTTTSNYPVPIEINLKDSGTLYVIDSSNNRLWKKSISASSKIELYNIIPGITSYFLLIKDNKIVQQGLLQPTGSCRMIHIPNVDNVRDIGGWACDGGTIKYGMLYRGGEVYNYISDESKDIALNLLGIRKEIDLRFDSDLNGRTESAFGPSVDMLHVDMSWNDLNYQRTSGNIKKIFNPLFDYVIAGHPTYFHCSAGADRTGVVALIIEAVLGMSQSDIDKEYELTCFYSGVSTDNDARRRNETVWMREINIINGYEGDNFRDKTVSYLLSCGITLDKINKFRKAMINGNPADLSHMVSSYTITNTLTNVTNSNSATSADKYSEYDAIVKPADGYVIDNITITMDGKDITSSVFSGTETNLRKSVTYSLTNCSTSNKKIYAIAGQSYVATLTPTEGYTISNISITMGDEDVSNYYSNGTISIPSVTGNIVITATATVQAPAYVDQLANAVNMSGTKIGKQWMYANKRYNSSSGDPIDNTGTNITGLIPCKAGDRVRMRFTGTSDKTYNVVKCFKSDRTECVVGYVSFYHLTQENSVFASDVVDDIANGKLEFTFKSSGSSKDMAYFAWVTTTKDISNCIVTINEEITD